ncbi:hypothetical protein ASE01_14190 [Nocardioides sp. Root190]|uniref:DUF2510 domain-containing protein n=1 Tax=Nocardioides sp. Root190 TaxID=1736488 RepID=UPI0006FCCD3B|nr:DUF2510 domain-containing protein [Nocardioides sp. Root190]KRB76169.1 hypothetical protein ASE01_14190 [Nocardioides sp. Root190]
MTNAGWYPDPAGAPDTYRYWDGQSWSQMTTTQPPSGAAPEQARPVDPGPAPSAPTQVPPGAYGAVPPTPQQPQQPYGQQPGQPGQQYGQYGQQPGQQYGQPQPWSPTPQQGGNGGGNGKTIGIVIAGVLVLVLIGIGGFFGVRALTGDDDGDKKADDPTSEPTDGSDPTDGTDGTDDPTDVPTNPVEPTGIQCTGGSPEAKDPGASPTTIAGGGLTIPVPTGYTVDVRFSAPHSFADAILVAYKPVDDSWITEFAVGGLPQSNGFDDLADAAEVIMKCLTANDQIYEGFSERKDLASEEITVDGKPAYRITSEIRVDNPEVTAEGDVTSVVVVDTGDPASYGLFLGVATIGDPASIALVDSQIDAIKVG